MNATSATPLIRLPESALVWLDGQIVHYRRAEAVGTDFGNARASNVPCVRPNCRDHYTGRVQAASSPFCDIKVAGWAKLQAARIVQSDDAYRDLSSFSPMINPVTAGLKGARSYPGASILRPIQILFNGGERFKNRPICQYRNYKPFEHDKCANSSRCAFERAFRL